MQNRSAAFDAAVVNSHVVVTKAEVWSGGKVAAVLPITDGTVTVDVSNAIRRRCSVKLSDYDGTLTPADATGLLVPNGNEIRLYRGILVNGSPELIALGVFGISVSTVDRNNGSLVISVDGYDRARKVQRAKFTAPYTIANGTNVASAIQSLISNQVSGLTYSLTNTSETTPALTYKEGDDPWQAASDLAASIGCELFFDVQGVCTMRPIPNPDTAAIAWTYDSGASAPTMTALQRQFSDTDVYNHVIVTGETTGNDTPVRGEAKDTNSTSPTYISGSFGDVPTFFTSGLVKTASAATSMAQSILNQNLGILEQTQLTAIPHPAHDAYDVITIADAETKANARYVIDQLTVPLSSGAMLQATSRKRI